jgi:lipopolysaccharide export system permease protein
MLWPQRFTRYILVDIVQLFLVALIGMTSVIMLGLIVQRLVTAGVSFSTLTQLLPYTTIISLQFAVPATMLFAVCTIYGRISADNEITAVKSIGVSPWRIIYPTLIFGFLMSPLAVWINDKAVSWGLPGIQQVGLHSLEEIVYKALRTNRSYVSEQGLTIHVHDVEGRWLIYPTISIYGDPGSEPQRISAEKASLRFNPEKESLTLELINWKSNNGVKWKLDGGPGSIQIDLPLSKAAQRGVGERSVSLVALRDIGACREEIQSEMDNRHAKLLTRNAITLVSGKNKLMYDPIIWEYRNTLADRELRLKRLNAEPYRRWAQGFSCFFFVWMGIPLAIIRKSADYTATFAICFLPILLIYYPLFMLGVEKSKGGAWHPASPWIANGMLFLLGAWMMRRVYRE